MLQLRSMIEETLAKALPGLIQARIASGLEQAVNPAIDAAIAQAISNVLGETPQRVVAAPVAKPSSEVKVKARATPKAKPAKKPAKAKAKPVAPDVDHKELTRSSRCVKADRQWMVLPSGAIYDIATRKPGKRKSSKGKAVRATLVRGARADADMAELERFGFRTRSVKGTNPCAAPCGRPCAFAPSADGITASLFQY